MFIAFISYDRVDMTVPYLTVSLDSDDDLAPFQVYTIVIEAGNVAGRTVSGDFTVCKLVIVVILES